MYGQLTIDGSTIVTSDIKVLPKNDGEIYRLWIGGDRWGCRKCNKTEDRFGMLEHVCKRNIKQIIDAISIAEYGLQPSMYISVRCTIAVKLNGI
jgi:hypothetical protein